jgi:hypothetical protein
MIVIGALEQTAQQRLDAENFKVLTTDLIIPDGVAGSIGLKPEIHDPVRGYGGEDGVALTDVAYLLVREICAVVAGLKGHHFAGIGNVKRAQDKRL